MSAVICKACASENRLRLFRAREMMLGRQEVFDYGECLECGSLQILRIPEDLSAYYPSDYFAYQELPASKRSWRKWLMAKRERHVKGAKNLIGWVMTMVFGPPLCVDAGWIELLGIRADQRVLDVGCGRGALLAELRARGFKHLTGADPFVPSEIHADGFCVLKRDMSQLNGSFDVIMMHHSLEHMPSPLEALNQLRRLLSPDGMALVRVPVAGCYAWRTYGADWFQLDAPRHLFIPSQKGFLRLAERAGLTVAKTVYDSTYLQFVVSEQYRRGVPLNQTDSHRYTRLELLAYAEKTRQLNETMDGDQAGFILRHATSA